FPNKRLSDLFWSCRGINGECGTQVIDKIALFYTEYKGYGGTKFRSYQKGAKRESGLMPQKRKNDIFCTFHTPIVVDGYNFFILQCLINFYYMRQIILDSDDPKSRPPGFILQIFFNLFDFRIQHHHVDRRRNPTF